jgi:hypothetical protein
MAENEKINLAEKLALLDGYYQPGIFVVPAGVEHCPDAEEETEVLLIEPRQTVNTGDAGGPMTAEPQLL